MNPDFSKDKIIFTIFNKCGYPEYYVYMDFRNEYWMNEYNLKKVDVYKRQVSAEKEKVDYKNPQKFEEWIRKTIRKVLDDLYAMSKLNGTCLLYTSMCIRDRA